MTDQGLQRTQGRKDTNPGSELENNCDQRPEQDLLFHGREPDDLRHRRRGIHGAEALFAFRQIDAHGIAGGGHGESQIDRPLVKPFKGA